MDRASPQPDNIHVCMAGSLLKSSPPICSAALPELPPIADVGAHLLLIKLPVVLELITAVSQAEGLVDVGRIEL